MKAKNMYNGQWYDVISQDRNITFVDTEKGVVSMATSDLEFEDVLMQKFKESWSELEKINFLQRKIILLSMAYYEHDQSWIEDYEYDEMCYQLVDLMNKCGEKEKSTYWYCYKDFDGSTGMDLYSKLNRKDKAYLNELLNICINTREKRNKTHSTRSQKAVKKQVKSKGRLF